MDIIFFNPPRYINGKYHKFNNALLWIASYLHQRNVKVRIVPLNHENYEDTIKRELEEHNPRYAAVSCKWWDTLYSSTYIATLIKKYKPSITTIAGGFTATYFDVDIVKNTDFDIVIRGDAEKPLYELIVGQEPSNCTFKEKPSIHQGYVQNKQDLDEVFLIDNLEEILSDTEVLTSYVWTGKGCNRNCVYCAGSAWNNMLSFNRSDIVFRPVGKVINDISILHKYPGVGRILINFDPLLGEKTEKYHLQLLESLEKKKFNCLWCSWSLPSKRIIDSLAETFNFVELSIDIQTLSERLRNELGGTILKGSFSDDALDEILDYCSQYDNFIIDISSLMGLPYENELDVKRIIPTADYFYDKYSNLRYPYVSPMNVEPGSPLHMNPEHYNMVLFRKTFDDFWRYTKRSFENNINCYQPKEYEGGVFHPLGVVSREDYESGQIFRTYQAWESIQKHIDQRSNERGFQRTMKFRKYGLSSVGLVGGIDDSSLVHREVE